MEKFKIVDLKIGEGSKGDKYYYCVVYSNLGYLVNAYLTKDDYEYLENTKDYYDMDLSYLLQKRYNRKTDKFSYYIKLQ